MSNQQLDEVITEINEKYGSVFEFLSIAIDKNILTDKEKVALISALEKQPLVKIWRGLNGQAV